MTPITHQRNHTFSNLWYQVGNISHPRHLTQAQSGSGQRAIKFVTHGMHKAIIVESDTRPGFNVKVLDLKPREGLIGEDNTVFFSRPLETEDLEFLLRQIDRWVVSYEIIFGNNGESQFRNLDASEQTRPTEGEEAARVVHDNEQQTSTSVQQSS